MPIDGITIAAIVFAVLAAIVFVFFMIRTKSSRKAGKGHAKNTKQNTKSNNKQIQSTVRSSIPYLHTFEEGIIETEPGVFTSAYRLADINFKIAPEEEQTNIFLKYGRVLNTFPTGVDFQIVIQNRNADRMSYFQTIQFAPQNDELNSYRREMNAILMDKMIEGRNNLSQEKLLIVSVHASSFTEAKKKLNELDGMIIKKFQELSRTIPIQRMSLADRLNNLFVIYNQDGEGYFYNAKNKDGEPVFDLSVMMQSGLTTKDVIGPASMEFENGSFMLGNTFGRTLYLETIPSFLSTDFLAELSDITCNLLVSLHYSPIDQQKAVKIVNNMSLNIEGQIADRQKKAGQNGYSADIVSSDLLRQQQYIRDLMNDMVSRDQKMYYVTLAVTVFGHSEEELEAMTRQVMAVGSNHMCSIKTLFFQQENGFNSTLPLCINRLLTSKMLTTESASIFIPYTTQELHQKNGLYYGLNDTSKNLIIYNRLYGENYNGLIFGESGNGKSFAAKQEMVSALLKDPKNVVYVVDPESEYVPLCEALGGQVIDLSPGSASSLNPLDMDIRYGDEADPVSLKVDFVISMVEIMFGNGRVMTPDEKSILSRCVKECYAGYLDYIDNQNRAGVNITCDTNSAPTLQTLLNRLSMCPESAARGLATTLEMYASSSTFSRRTNVDINSRFVVYNIKNLGTGTKDLGIHICVNDIWNRMIENRKNGLYTWFYIDEFYLLLQSENSAKFVSSIWKRARKWNGVPTGILQNTEDILRTADSRSILNNTSFIQMLSLKRIDRANLGELLSISEAQQEYITDAGKGRGLIYAGKTILPFVNEFPKNSSLYEVMDTSSESSFFK